MIFRGACVIGCGALCAVDLSLVPSDATPRLGSTIAVSLIATADGPEAEPVAAMDILLGWDPAKLTLLGVDASGGGPFLSAGFPAGDAFGLNEADPPGDGDALFTALAPFGSPFMATPDGSLICEFAFEAAGEGETLVEVLPTAGNPAAFTKVFSASVPNLDILGSTEPAVVSIGPPCPPDLSGDGAVDAQDLGVLLDAFGATDAGDINGDRQTDSIDLNLLLAHFGEECDQ